MIMIDDADAYMHGRPLAPDDAAERRRRWWRRGHRPQVGGATIVAGEVRRARHRHQAQPSAPQIILIGALVVTAAIYLLLNASYGVLFHGVPVAMASQVGEAESLNMTQEEPNVANSLL